MNTPTNKNSKLTGYKGAVFYFTDNPKFNKNAYHFFPNGVLYIADGKVVEAGNFSELQAQYPQAEIVDYSGKLITPGLMDSHVHYIMRPKSCTSN
ncbi:MAG TPA: hypothetical protein PLP75_06100 [Burkholderiales bacterium]|nr:hypothetical protein [Burkholderiales bacterium]